MSRQNSKKLDQMIEQLLREKTMSRRRYLNFGIGAASSLSLGASLSLLSNKNSAFGNTLRLSEVSPQHRFCLIMLDGGWNSHFSTDPIIGDRRTNENFDATLNALDVKSPTGKEALLTGPGLIPAHAAFVQMPTAFINGLYVDVPAHNSASAFMLTGKNLVGRVVTEPSLPAILASSIGGFASHVVFGGTVPLGNIIESSPPLVTSGRNLDKLLTAPTNELSDKTKAKVDETLKQLNQGYFSRLQEKSKTSVEAFFQSQNSLTNIFETYADKFKFSDEIKARYDLDNAGNNDRFIAALLCFQHQLTSIVTIRLGGFDTHTNEMGNQLPRQQDFANGLKLFVEDLKNSPDPQEPTKSLADNTTILVASEFVRTPKFNDTDGTDHYFTASCIAMGRGIKDNIVLGKTDATGNAMGWLDGKPVERTDETQITAGNLVATILQNFGRNEEADAISKKRLDELLG